MDLVEPEAEPLVERCLGDLVPVVRKGVGGAGLVKLSLIG